MLGVIISQTLIGITKSVVLSRITTKLKVPVESATMMRVLGLPVSFFKKYSSGDLSARVQSMAILSNMIVDILLSSGLSTILSVAYIIQIFKFSPTLAIPALLVIGVTLLFTLLSMLLQMRQTKKIFNAKAKENGLVFSLLSGIQKIKITGAEKRAFSKWSGYYKDVLQHKYNSFFFFGITKYFLLKNHKISVMIPSSNASSAVRYQSFFFS
jgi:ABC-type bacteriocin/lantibiotic exporter with double-glycine peptidase domain